MADPIFEALKFRNLTVKNRIFRSNVSGRFDNYDGSGTQARINWEVKFARRRAAFSGSGTFSPMFGQRALAWPRVSTARVTWTSRTGARRRICLARVGR